MDPVDPKLQARVWQRVKGEQPSAGAGLSELYMEQSAIAAVYRQLARQNGAREAMLALHRRAQEHCACLRGICAMSGGHAPAARTATPVREPLSRALRSCYAREIRCLRLYEGRAADPEYGPVFAALAAGKREDCRTLLTLLGSLPQP